ncbi:MAG: rhomboid family intramembrane serine protease [Actinomycetota bacterium]
MFPIGDDNSGRRSFPLVTLLLVAACVLVFLWQQGGGAAGFEQSVRAFGTIPYEITTGRDLAPRGPDPIYLTLISSMFMHANWMHLGGNMLFLWIFGDNLEDRMGKGKYLAFYLLCGLAASAAQIMMNPDGKIPGIGASGAIAGVMGGYLVLLPGARVRTLSRYGVTEVPAWMMLGLWILTQVLAGAAQWGGQEVGGVAYAAHVGGFIAGLVLVKLFAPGAPARQRAAA